MNGVDAITVLTRCREAESEIRRLKKRIRQRRSALTDISAPQMDPNGGGRGSGDRDKISRQFSDIEALEEQMRARGDARAVEIAVSCALLDRLGETESDVLYGYYVRGETVAGIAGRLRYSDGYVRKVKRAGEASLAEIPEGDINDMLPAWYMKKYGK